MDEERVENTMENPLVVHKESDASYQVSVDDYTMNDTHFEDDAPTLERHRFRKEPKKKSATPLIICVIIIVCAAIVAGLYITGTIGNNKANQTTTVVQSTTVEKTTSLQEAYKDTIVVKMTYIFVDGEEVDGINGLQSALKYETPDTSRYTIINEHADASFFNDNVLPLLVDMKFYDEKTPITHKNLTGLVAEEEKTTVATTKKNKKSNKNKKKSTTKSTTASDDE